MRSIVENDYGTPAIQSIDSLKLVRLEIDGVAVKVPAGTSVLRAAATNGIAIPKLCATDSLDAYGSCRLCLVQIEGMKGFPASCTTPVADGMRSRRRTRASPKSAAASWSSTSPTTRLIA